MFEIMCPVCESRMRYSQRLTIENFSLPENFVLDDIDKLVDGIIGNYLIYECPVCHAVEKCTYKDLEKIERKRISQMVIDLKARGVMLESGVLSLGNKVMVFCGGCKGFDSKGSCLIETYKTCELKKLPRL